MSTKRAIRVCGLALTHSIEVWGKQLLLLREYTNSVRERLIDSNISMAFRIRQGRHFNVPVPGLSYTETFLYLLDHLGEEDYQPNPVVSKALDVLFILHGRLAAFYNGQTLKRSGSSGPRA